MANFETRKLAVPAVCLLVSFLAYSSQLLFLSLDPGPLTRPELFKFNSLVACIWVSYLRACSINPGKVPSHWTPGIKDLGDVVEGENAAGSIMTRKRWCRRCKVSKPPRAHHCKTCGRFGSFTYVPKARPVLMNHR
jgi:palmitoyltransferase